MQQQKKVMNGPFLVIYITFPQQDCVFLLYMGFGAQTKHCLVTKAILEKEKFKYLTLETIKEILLISMILLICRRVLDKPAQKNFSWMVKS